MTNNNGNGHGNVEAMVREMERSGILPKSLAKKIGDMSFQELNSYLLAALLTERQLHERRFVFLQRQIDLLRSNQNDMAARTALAEAKRDAAGS